VIAGDAAVALNQRVLRLLRGHVEDFGRAVHTQASSQSLQSTRDRGRRVPPQVHRLGPVGIGLDDDPPGVVDAAGDGR
jgi:hypothetical protein